MQIWLFVDVCNIKSTNSWLLPSLNSRTACMHKAKRRQRPGIHVLHPSSSDVVCKHAIYSRNLSDATISFSRISTVHLCNKLRSSYQSNLDHTLNISYRICTNDIIQNTRSLHLHISSNHNIFFVSVSVCVLSFWLLCAVSSPHNFTTSQIAWWIVHGTYKFVDYLNLGQRMYECVSVSTVSTVFFLLVSFTSHSQ